MKQTANAGDAEPLANNCEITRDISLAKFRAVLAGKEPIELAIRARAIEDLAQLNAHCYESVLVSLAYDPDA